MKFILTQLDKIIGPIIDQFFPRELMWLEYKCNKCGYVYEDESSDKFVKTMMKKCPSCGSTDVSLNTVSKKKVAKKTN